MSKYTQDSNYSNRSINAKSQHSPLDKRNDQHNDQRNTGTRGNEKSTTTIKPTQPNQTGTKTNPNNKGPQTGNQWKASPSKDNCGSTSQAPGRNA